MLYAQGVFDSIISLFTYKKKNNPPFEDAEKQVQDELLFVHNKLILKVILKNAHKRSFSFHFTTVTVN
jgi:hypothetical protein